MTNERIFKQTSFLSIVANEFRLRMIGGRERTLAQAVMVDFLPTVEAIRRLYVPNYDGADLEGLTKGFDWIVRADVFNINWFPSYVSESNYRTLSAFIKWRATPEVHDNSPLEVARAPRSVGWKNDLRVATLSTHTQMKSGIFRTDVPLDYSDPESGMLAKDYLTSVFLGLYWDFLKTRSEKITNWRLKYKSKR